jgi:hypothetical protein
LHGKSRSILLYDILPEKLAAGNAAYFAGLVLVVSKWSGQIIGPLLGQQAMIRLEEIC